MALNKRDYGPDSQKMAGNEQIAQEVANNRNGIGYVGLAYIYTEGVKVLPVNGISPDESTYPIARELYFLIDKNKPLSEAANLFLGFCLSPKAQAITQQVHFLPLYWFSDPYYEWRGGPTMSPPFLLVFEWSEKALYVNESNEYK